MTASTASTSRGMGAASTRPRSAELRRMPSSVVVRCAARHPVAPDRPVCNFSAAAHRPVVQQAGLVADTRSGPAREVGTRARKVDGRAPGNILDTRRVGSGKRAPTEHTYYRARGHIPLRQRRRTTEGGTTAMETSVVDVPERGRFEIRLGERVVG